MTEKEAPHPLLRIWTFGNFLVERRSKTGGQWEAVSSAEWKGSQHPKSLLKILVCSSKRRARRDTLIDTLWHDLDPDVGENYLSNAAYKLRQVFKGHEYLLKTFGDHRDSGYELADQSRIWVDADACEHLLLEAEHLGRSSADAFPLLQEAMRYFEQGKFLPQEEGLWCYGKRGVLDRLSYRCRIWLAEAYEQQGSIGLAEKQYETLLEEDLADEDVLCRLMMLHHKQGMTSLAQKCYEDISRQLEKEGQELSSAATTLMGNLRKQSQQLEIEPAYTRTSTLGDSSPEHGDMHLLGRQYFHSLLRRQFLQQLFDIAGGTVLWQGFTPWVGKSYDHMTNSVIEEFILQCDANIGICWRLMKGCDIFAVRSLLASWLPALEMLIEQPSKHQKQLAQLAAQGYILSGLVAVLQRRYDGAEWCCKQAIEYSRLAEDNNLLVASLKHLATKYNSANYPLLTLRTYQEALPLVDHVSPLLCSRTYLGLALSYAQCQRKHEADHYLGLAQDMFPERPEDDPSFIYADCGRPSLNHYGGLIHLEFGQPQQAWEIFAEVEKLATETTVPERTLIEIVDCQAEAATMQKDMELAYAHLQAGLAGALKLNSEKRFHDAYRVYQKMEAIWPHEQRMRQLKERFHQEGKNFMRNVSS